MDLAQCDIDYELVSKYSSWKVGEATSFTLGVIVCDLNCFDDKYSNLYQLISRAVEDGVLSNPIKPLQFVEWAENNDISLPKELIDAVKKNSKITQTHNVDAILAENAKLKKEVERLGLSDNVKRVEGAKKLMGGLVKVGLIDFDPKKQRNKGKNAAYIDDLLLRAGITVDKGIIRDFIREGFEMIESDLSEKGL